MPARRRTSEGHISLYVDIGARVRAARVTAGRSQDDLAQAVSLTRTSITNLESGRQQVPLHTLYAIAENLGCHVFDLLPKTAPPTRGSEIGDDDINRWTSQLASPPPRRL
jgi:transcriptional regulator with XRE-family HTH domain